ncbi:DUF4136 domain-containing protein [Xanthocytophaga flava]|uniref:DUF4136 domain-containing protein n=1 Tax=Xanthocytophaga flava TaxID=3048013 RepID=UPI0028D328F2|nr:DUF4136 domain-containing protein [Xanthocytophaga flavus]MDJ1467844.1 DUF4136 domain-containing protein [Xanthocytophaga flavus]
MKTAVNCLWIVLLISVSSCASLSVRSDYDRQANFRRYTTYTIENPPVIGNDPIMGSELNRRRIVEAVESEMNARGYVRNDADADLMVRFQTDSKDRQQIQSNMASPMWGWWGQPNNISSRTYEENRIIIGVWDNQNRQMIWQGWASGQLTAQRKEKNMDAAIRNAVYRIMEQYPAKERLAMNRSNPK